MGKQSSRMIYRGKDHKDIYFQGHYHDAMYLGYELLWHKIRQEGYYVFIVPNGKEGRYEKGLYIITFDEKTQEFEIIMDVKNHPDMFQENFYRAASLMDSERIYMSNVIDGDIIYASIDGIHFEKTNLKLENNVDYYPFFSQSYHSYSEKNDNGISKKVNYTWYFGTLSPNDYIIYVQKFTITKNGNDYTIKQKGISTGLRVRSPFSSEDVIGTMYAPEYGESRFAIHSEVYNWKTNPKLTTRYTRNTIKYYDTEKEESGEIAKFEYLSYKQDMEHPDSAYKSYSHNISLLPGSFFHVNGVYIFFLADIEGVFGIYSSINYYVYYSFDGITYNNSLIYSKYTSLSYEQHEFPFVELVLYRKGMYYLYAGGEKDEIYEPPYTVFLTTDFKHFQKKQIPREITIDGETRNTMKLIESESKVTNREKRYFYDGEISEPENGLVIYTGNLIYIDNMFFRESKGNKILKW